MTIVDLINLPEGECQVADTIRKRRGLIGLETCDQAMRHIPSLANGWNELLKACRNTEAISGKLRELLILRTTFVLNVEYEHQPHVETAENNGLTEEQIKFTRQPASELPSTEKLKAIYKDDELVLGYKLAHQSSKSVHVDDDLTNEMKAKFGQKRLVEMISVVSAYNFTGRIIKFLHVTR